MTNLTKRVWACLLALVLVVGLMPTNVYATEGESNADVVYISSKEDLIAFRNAVNNENDFAGKTVMLLADIDMAGEDWSVNIGDDACYGFAGTFDGNGHTIYNLSSTETAQKADGYVCTGLFAVIEGSAVIKNLTLANVNINTGAYTGNNVSALVGYAWKATGTISNVHVTGSINGENISGVGAMVGYVYGGNPTIKDCTVDVDVNGAAYVGGIAGYGGNVKVTNCTVNNSTITGSSACVGGVMGLSLDGAVATNNTVNNTAITATHENWQNSAAVVVGTMAGKTVTVSGTNCSNVTLNGVANNVLVGSEYKNKPTTPVAKVEASVNGVYYLTLQEAIAVANAGETVVLVNDIALSESLTIGTDKNIVLDLNGKTLSGVDNATGSYGLINVMKGNLTVMDTVGTGKITLTATNNRGWVSYSSVISNQQGVVTVVSGTIEHTGGTNMAYAIDNLTNGGIGDATLNVNGGVLTSTYRAIRQFANSATHMNTLNVTGGEVVSTSGNKGAIWLQSSNANANKATLNITGGTVSSVYVDAPSDASEVKVMIADNCVNAVTEEVSAGCEMQVKVNGVSSNGSFQEAVNAANGGEVTLLTDITLAERVTVTNDAVINLNGKTITSPECVFVVEGGLLTIKGEGNVKSNVDNDDGMAIAVWARGGHAEIYGGNYYFGSDDVDDAYDHQTEGIYTSGGGTIKIYGGEYFSAKGVWTLNEHDSNRGTLTVYGGKFHNFDPSNNVSEGEGTSFVPEDYVTSKNEDGNWSVAKKETPKVENTPSAPTTSVVAPVIYGSSAPATETNETVEENVEDVVENVVENTVEIEEEEVPLAPGEEETVEPETEEPAVEIEEEEVPLASAESTSMNFMWIIVFALALGVIVLVVLNKKTA